ncbi:hypothetical protein HUK80_12610 [Flavobacterium sp. MAH-1]|uniref:Uncharacterized protein n=1 Tax=Flavobacterium agri TaxID=2743471 RepID=A0A7Y8Y3E6_9FLAO|nr:hypothetical protein [Flavobacterium agri]NUY81742.1 hypothetical protein [Flavobacterium agri]NYA71766.1 hypothetical protein [Flavobacterium agri]
MGKKSNFFKILKSRIDGLRIELKILAIITFTSILLYEFWLNKIPAANSFFYDFGIVCLKLSYSYISAFIFYFLVVYAPKERKKVRALRFLNNKIHVMKNLTALMIQRICDESGNPINNPDNLSLEEIKRYCESISINHPIRNIRTGEIVHPNMYEYIQEKSQKIKTSLDQLISLHELLDDELFHRFSNMSDIIARELTFEIYGMNIPNLKFLGEGLYNLNCEKKKMYTYFNSKYYPRYYFQYLLKN